METIELDDAPPRASSASANGSANDHTTTSAIGGFPADPPSDLWLETSATSSLPPPIAVHSSLTSSSIAIGSPLISFSPVAASSAPAPFALDTVAPTSSSSIVDDLLSFSPVAAAPLSSLSTATPPPSSDGSSAFGSMMDDFSFFAPPTPTPTQPPPTSSDIVGVGGDGASLLSFSPVASTQPSTAAFLDEFAVSDAAPTQRGSFSGFDAPVAVEAAPKSSPPALPSTEDATVHDAILSTEVVDTFAHVNVGSESTETETHVQEEEEEDEASIDAVVEEETKVTEVVISTAVERHSGTVAMDEHVTMMSLDTEFGEEATTEEHQEVTEQVGSVTYEESSTLGWSAQTEDEMEDGDGLESRQSWASADTAEPSSVVAEASVSWNEGSSAAADHVAFENFPQSPSVDQSEDGHNEEQEQGETDWPAGYEVYQEYAEAQRDSEAAAHTEVDLNYADVGEKDASGVIDQVALENPISVSVPAYAEPADAGTASVASSPGSSVAGSAFAFIAAGAFSPTASSDADSESKHISMASPIAATTSAACESSPSLRASDTPDRVFDEEVQATAQVEETVHAMHDAFASYPASVDAVEISSQANDHYQAHADADHVVASSVEEFEFEDEAQGQDKAGSPLDGDDLSEQPTVSTIDWAQPAGITTVAVQDEPAQTARDEDDDDDFGGFTQSATTTTAGGFDDDDDDFGDFGASTAWGSSNGGGAQESGFGGQEDDDDFGDFTPAPNTQQWGEAVASSAVVHASSSSWSGATPAQAPPAQAAAAASSMAAPTDLKGFFLSAFPASATTASSSSLPEPTSSANVPMHSVQASSILDLNNAGALHKSFHASLHVYRAMLTGEFEDVHHQPPQQAFDSEALRIKYLKYVLNEKLTEASKTDGVFPHGSNTYHILHSIAESGNEKDMRAALARLQNALFHSSVNDAVMRLAQQAALSAKARIAEQAAQQQAHSRGSLLATTRHFLSRNTGSSNGGHGPNGSVVDKEHPVSSSNTGTPNSSQRGGRFPSSHNGSESSGHDAASSGYGSGEDNGSDASAGEASSHSEGGEYTGGSGPPSASSSSSRSGGGLMRKFQDRFTSFSSTKHRSRTVSLRRMGQSSEDVRKMELQMESISGGFDEVKWRCAVYLYETEEVAHLAPSQIKIFAYPSNQLLTGKSDKSLLTKFFKPGSIWSIDIGANSNSGVPME